MYNGGIFQLDHNTMGGGFLIASDRPELEAYAKLLYDFGFLKVPAKGPYGYRTPSNPIPRN